MTGSMITYSEKNAFSVIPMSAVAHAMMNIVTPKNT